MIGIRLMIDTSKCIGCRACQVACQQWHSLPAEETTFTGVYQNPSDLSAANLTVTKFREVRDTKLNWLFFKDQCRHCDEPPCLKSCPLRAIVRQQDGIVRIDSKKCFPYKCSKDMSKPCQKECKFKQIPRYRYVKGGSLVMTKMRKCDLCYNRMAYDFNHNSSNNPTWDIESRKPACQITCPSGAISLGNADQILIEAKNRVNYLKTHGFPEAKVYPGDSTHIIWTLTREREQYGQ